MKRDESPTGAQLLIMSDANLFFINTILQNSVPRIVPNEIITNPANPEEDGSLLLLEPYENQTECEFCPPNLCKGAALGNYITRNGPFDAVYYTGDGRNDLVRFHSLNIPIVFTAFLFPSLIVLNILYYFAVSWTTFERDRHTVRTKRISLGENNRSG